MKQILTLLSPFLLILAFIQPAEALHSPENLCTNLTDRCVDNTPLLTTDSEEDSCRPPLRSDVKEVESGKASITWDPSNTAIGYKIRLRRQGAEAWEFILNTGFTHLFTFTQLDSCTTYEYIIRARCVNGESDYSQVFTFTTRGNCFLSGTSNYPTNRVGKLDVQVFPNPANDLISVQMVDRGVREAHLHLLNSEGQLLKNTIIQIGKTLRFDTSSFPPGLYWCKVFTSDGKYLTNERLLIQR